MKKAYSLSAVLAVLAAGVIFAAGPNPESDFRCDIASGDVDALRIVEYIGSSSTVVIPDTIEGYPVTEIDSRTFKKEIDRKLINRKDITSVTIPATVTLLLGTDGYYNNKGLFSDMKCDVIFNDFNNIKEIGSGTFNGFGGKILHADGTPLTAENFSNVEIFGEECFAGTALTGKLTLTDKVKSIGIRAFRGSGIKEVVFDGYNCVDKYSNSLNTPSKFEHCGSLESVLVKKDMNFSENDFSNCASLKKVEFADGVHLDFPNRNEHATFYSCENLTDVVIDENVELKKEKYHEYTLEYHFSNCPNLSIKSKFAIRNLDKKFPNHS